MDQSLTPKKSTTRKKYLPKFSYLNINPEIANFKPKKSFDHPCHLKSGVPRMGPKTAVDQIVSDSIKNKATNSLQKCNP